MGGSHGDDSRRKFLSAFGWLGLIALAIGVVGFLLGVKNQIDLIELIVFVVCVSILVVLFAKSQ